MESKQEFKKSLSISTIDDLFEKELRGIFKRTAEYGEVERFDAKERLQQKHW